MTCQFAKSTGDWGLCPFPPFYSFNYHFVVVFHELNINKMKLKTIIKDFNASILMGASALFFLLVANATNFGLFYAFFGLFVFLCVFMFDAELEERDQHDYKQKIAKLEYELRELRKQNKIKS